ncbi:MAG TPA: TRAP transporter small permease [Aminobacterium sp.]|jgi:TRAP-type C4-dicarboxylate transport system permease small subunit|uniref:TRAP transporter small permease n=1 Tax=Aminobacterium TaxID=81466 RepID=UPI000EE63DEB|nr:MULTISPECIES: TRAP transporter small permease [unclassified Aminobacterium]HCA41092.1 TRAP transporter small permease [Aminobacterium sp.]
MTADIHTFSEKWIFRLERFSAWSAGALLVINVGDVLLGIFMRYIMKSSAIWTEEVARFSLVWLVMVGATGALCHGDHMVVDFVTPRLPQKFQRIIKFFQGIITLLVLGAMVYLGSINAIKIWGMRTMALNIPKTVPLLSVPVGCALLLAETSLFLFRSIRNGGQN